MEPWPILFLKVKDVIPAEGDASTAAACGYHRRQGSGGIQAYSGRYINMEGGGKQ